MFLLGVRGKVNRVYLKVKNTSDQKIEKILFTTEDAENTAKIKRLKVNDEKKTSISNFKEIKNLKMSIEGCEKSYILKEKIEAAQPETVLITIKSFNEKECNYTIEKVFI